MISLALLLLLRRPHCYSYCADHIATAIAPTTTQVPCTCVFTRTHTHKEPYHRPLRRPINTHPRTHDTCTQRHTHWRNRIRGLSARHKQHVAKEDRLPPFRCVYACYSISNVHVCTPPQEIVCPDNARPLSLSFSLSDWQWVEARGLFSRHKFTHAHSLLCPRWRRGTWAAR